MLEPSKRNGGSKKKEMPVKINDVQYYRTNEACVLAGITKNTFLRWVSNGSFPDIKRRDRRGWRLFTEDDIKRLKVEVNRINVGQLKG